VTGLLFFELRITHVDVCAEKSLGGEDIELDLKAYVTLKSRRGVDATYRVVTRFLRDEQDPSRGRQQFKYLANVTLQPDESPSEALMFALGTVIDREDIGGVSAESDDESIWSLRVFRQLSNEDLAQLEANSILNGIKLDRKSGWV